MENQEIVDFEDDDSVASGPWSKDDLDGVTDESIKALYELAKYCYHLNDCAMGCLHMNDLITYIAVEKPTMNTLLTKNPYRQVKKWFETIAHTNIPHTNIMFRNRYYLLKPYKYAFRKELHKDYMEGNLIPE
jgi:hypothetical protein